MQTMVPNVAEVIGSAVADGVFICALGRQKKAIVSCSKAKGLPYREAFC